MATIRAVADDAGVSPSTVSRYLNGQGYVSDGVRRRIDASIAALNYRPNPHARRLRGGRSRTIALIFTQVTHPFSAEVAHAIEEVALARGYFVVVGNTHQDSALFDHYLETFIGFGVDGLVIVPPALTKRVISSVEAVRVPYVLIDQRIPALKVDQVVTDNVDGAYRLTAHLISLGHRRIAFIGGDPKRPKGRERLEGYQRSLADHGIAVDPELTRMRDTSEQSGFALTEELLKQTRPDAIFAANLDVHLGVMAAVHAAGLAAPDEIALAGFDALPYAAQFAPYVAVVAQQTRSIGVIAAQLLIDKLEGKRDRSDYQTVLLQPELIVREEALAVPR